MQQFVLRLCIRFYIVEQRDYVFFFLDESLLDRLAKVAASPFSNWAYSTTRTVTIASSSDSVPPTTETPPSKYVPDTAQANAANAKNPEVVLVKPAAKRGRKRIHPLPNSESEPKRIMIEPKNNKEKEKENKIEKEPKEQIQLQQLYYATMEGDKDIILKEHKSSLHFKVCSKLLPVAVVKPRRERYMFIVSCSVFPMHGGDEL